VTAIRLFQSAATGQPAFTPEMSSDGSNGSGNGGNGGGSGGSAQATTPAAGSLPVVQLAVRSLPVLGRHFGEADTLRRYGCGDDRSSSSSRGNRSGDDNGGNRSGGSDDSRSGDR
jgi:hypothetical protein